MLPPAEKPPISRLHRLKPMLSRLPGHMLQALLLCLTARARMAGLAPFAPAFMAAGLFCRFSPTAMLLGCAAGSLMTGFTAYDFLPFFSCCLTALCFLPVRLFSRRDRDGLYPMQDFLAGMAACLSSLIPGLLLSGGLAYNLMTAFLTAAVSALLAPALISALTIRPHRRLLMPDEQLSLALTLLLMLMCVRHAPFIGRQASVFFAVLLTLCLSFSGPGAGAMGGVACGAALSLSGSDPFLGATLSLCGLLSGCARLLSRPVAALTFCAGSLLTITWGLGYTIGALEPAPLLAAAAVYCLIPIRWLERARRWTQPMRPRADPERMAVRMRRSAARQLDGLGEVFGELADGYQDASPLPGEKQLIAAMRQALCEGCEGYAACWQGDRAQAGRLLCRLAAQALSGKAVTPAADLPPDLLRHCRRSSRMDRQLLPLLTRLTEARAQSLRRGEAKTLLSRQFRQAQRQLTALSTRLKSPCCLNEQYASLAAAALERASLPVKELIAVVDDRFEIIAVLDGRIWSASAARQAAALLTDEMGIPFSPVLSKGRAPGECELHLIQAPALTASIGAACCPADTSAPCGDSHFARALPDGRLLMALSDGMGSGEAAAGESRKCVSLLRKFVTAGIDREDALNAVNSLLLLRGGEDMFATADLCVVDLHTGVASFSKLGACSAYLLRGKQVIRIPGGQLPLGVLDRVEAETRTADVQPGDLIVMLSDGVSDDLKPGDAEWLEAQLPALRPLPPQQAADRLLSLALTRKGDLHDDMTVLTARILARPIRRA